MDQNFFNESSESDFRNHFHKQATPFLKKQVKRWGRKEVILGNNEWKVKKVAKNLVLVFKNAASTPTYRSAWVKRLEFSSKPEEPSALKEHQPLNAKEWICFVEKIS